MILNYTKKLLQYLKWKIGGEKYESHTIPLNGQMPIYTVQCFTLKNTHQPFNDTEV